MQKYEKLLEIVLKLIDNYELISTLIFNLI